jgi:phosphoserine phosphatase RsbU/P
MKKLTLQHAVLTLLLVWAALAQITFSSFMVYIQATSGDYARVPFVTQSYTTRISLILPGYENSGLRIRDEVLALNGLAVHGLEQIDSLRFEMHPGDTLNITLRRGAAVINLPIVVHRFRSQALGWTTVIGLDLLLPISCLAIGFLIALLRPRDPLAWITMAMLASFGQIAGGGSYWAIWPPWRQIFIVYHSVLNGVWPLLLVLFALNFPVPFAFVRKHSWLVWTFAAPFAVFVALGIYGDLLEGNHIAQLTWLAAVVQHTQTGQALLFTSCVAVFLTSLGLKKRKLETPDARRRLNVMIAGSSIAAIPLLVYVVVDLGLSVQLPDWVNSGSLLLLLVFPATMFYVIVVQRAMDLRMVVRTGVRYAFASTGLRILRLILVAVVVALTLQFSFESEQHWQAILIGIVGASIIFGLGRIGAKVSEYTDRSFFREAYDAEVILTELGNTVAGIRDTKTLLETVARRIDDSLHVQPIAVLVEKDDCYRPAHWRGFEEIPRVELRKNSGTIRFLKELRAPAKVYFDDPQAWVHGMSRDDQAAIRDLHSNLLIPVTMGSRFLGIISMGPKKSEAPYSRADLHLLGAVATQTGLALENARLTDNIRREVAQRERLNRELEIARDVQQRLFPQRLPEVKGLDFAGYCRPAFGVGGDYYDFIRLDDGCLGIAVGDVSGKGIAAALMMASLQASLRGQTIKPIGTVSEMIQHINRLVYEASADNHYATFFYAQYDPATRNLRFVNAGHNPPIVCRKRTGRDEVYRLEEGGTVVGLFPDFPYHEAQMQFEPGDILVAYTDGITEAMNKREEEFGEERLIETIRRSDSRSAADIIAAALDNVDAFTSGAPQHDDMTLVVVRVQ